MRTILLWLICGLTIIFTYSGCVRQRTLSPAHWLPAGGEFDSLTNKLERQFNNCAPNESILNIVKRMERLAAQDSDCGLKMSRALYWRGRLLGRLQDPDSAWRVIGRALELNDSVKYRYDRLRMLTVICSQTDSVDGATRYRIYEESLDYARKSGDKVFEAITAVNMGNLLSEIREYEKALDYLRLADSLTDRLGYDRLTLRNRVNRAAVFSESGDKLKSDSILRTLIGHPALEGDTFSMNLVPRNLYVSTYDSVKYLYQAYEGIKENIRFRPLRGLYRALLIDYNARMGRDDSVQYYADLVREDLPYVSNYSHKAIVWFNLGLAHVIAGSADSALFCRVVYEDYIDSVHRQQRVSDVLRLSALHEIKKREAGYSASIFRRNMIMAFVVMTLLAAGVIVALTLNRRNLRQKMASMRNELELEKAKRKMAATVLTIEEKDKVLDTLKTELSEMRQEGEIREGDARRLELTIKSHLLEHD